MPLAEVTFFKACHENIKRKHGTGMTNHHGLLDVMELYSEAASAFAGAYSLALLLVSRLCLHHVTWRM